MATRTEAVRYGVRSVNNTPQLLRGALPGSCSGAALEVPPGSAVETFDIPVETAMRLLSKGANATRRGRALIFELVVDVTP